MKYVIGVTSEFRRDYRKLSEELKGKLKHKGKIFAESPFHPFLRTHTLSGKLAGFWSFSIDNRIRVMFEFCGETKILLHRVGDHSIYRKQHG